MIVIAEAASPFLAPWANFYVMTGSAAAALTGLMFVVITLVTGEERSENLPDGIATFSTPTVAHFSVALLTSAILNAPWPALVYPAALLGLAGLGGVVYLARVTLKTTLITVYDPDVEDWVWYSVLPFVAYGAILAGAIGLVFHPGPALFAVAGGILSLIFIGIRNAWDVVTFLATK